MMCGNIKLPCQDILTHSRMIDKARSSKLISTAWRNLLEARSSKLKVHFDSMEKPARSSKLEAQSPFRQHGETCPKLEARSSKLRERKVSSVSSVFTVSSVRKKNPPCALCPP